MKPQLDRRVSPEARWPDSSGSLKALFDTLGHDIRKPVASIRMFFDVLSEIDRNSDDVCQWKEKILGSFGNVDQLLRELDVLCRTELGESTRVALSDMFDLANERVGKTFWRAESRENAVVASEPELLVLLFQKLAEATASTYAGAHVSVASSEPDTTTVQLLFTPIDHRPLQATCTQTLAWSIVRHVLALHRAKLNYTQEADGTMTLSFQLQTP